MMKIFIILILILLIVYYTSDQKYMEHYIVDSNVSENIVNKNIIWLYWETPKNKTKPYFIELCHKLIYVYNPNSQVIMLNSENISDYITVPKGWYKLKHIAHKADYVRIAILYKYGGIYVDSDTVMLDSLDAIFELLQTYDFVAFEYRSILSDNDKNKLYYYDINDIVNGETKYTYRVPISFLASKPNTILFREWLKMANDAISNDPNKSWHFMGRDILMPLLEKYVEDGQIKYYAFYAEKTIVPIKKANNHLFFTDLPLDYVIRKDAYIPFIMLFNSFMPGLKKISRKSIIENKNLINRIFNYTCTKSNIDL